MNRELAEAITQEVIKIMEGSTITEVDFVPVDVDVDGCENCGSKSTTVEAEVSVEKVNIPSEAELVMKFETLLDRVSK